jgi:hypothetical protein
MHRRRRNGPGCMQPPAVGILLRQPPPRRRNERYFVLSLRAARVWLPAARPAGRSFFLNVMNDVTVSGRRNDIDGDEYVRTDRVRRHPYYVSISLYVPSCALTHVICMLHQLQGNELRSGFLLSLNSRFHPPPPPYPGSILIP